MMKPAAAEDDERVWEELLGFATSKLAVNALFAPCEVASTLAQVQYRPRRRDPSTGRLLRDDDDDEDDDGGRLVGGDDDDSDDDSDDAQIADNAATSASARPAPVSIAAPVRPRRRGDPRAEAGYLYERHRPSLPALRGIRHGIRAVVAREGWLALWNGNFVQTWTDVSTVLVQPSVESVLNETLGLDDTTPFALLERRLPNLGTVIASHVVTALLMSPLQVLRTRLIVQKSAADRTKYFGVRHGLTTIVREEGVAGWYRGLSASLAYAVLVPVCQAFKAVVLSDWLALRGDSMAYVLGDFVLTSAQLVVSFPVLTAQRRLQAQWSPVRRRGRLDRPFDPAVALSPLRYTGMVDCIQRVAREEGVGALFRGFAYQWTGTVVVSLLSSLARLDDEIDVEQTGDVLRSRDWATAPR